MKLPLARQSDMIWFHTMFLTTIWFIQLTWAIVDPWSKNSHCRFFLRFQHSSCIYTHCKFLTRIPFPFYDEQLCALHAGNYRPRLCRCRKKWLILIKLQPDFTFYAVCWGTLVNIYWHVDDLRSLNRYAPLRPTRTQQFQMMILHWAPTIRDRTSFFVAGLENLAHWYCRRHMPLKELLPRTCSWQWSSMGNNTPYDNYCIVTIVSRFSSTLSRTWCY